MYLSRLQSVRDRRRRIAAVSLALHLAITAYKNLCRPMTPVEVMGSGMAKCKSLEARNTILRCCARLFVDRGSKKRKTRRESCQTRK